jgi:hypothetical protein
MCRSRVDDSRTVGRASATRSLHRGCTGTQRIQDRPWVASSAAALPIGLVAVAYHRPGPRRRCPFPECPSHTQARPRAIVRHDFMKSRHGSRLRLLCPTCGRTFCNRRGSAYYRLQHPRAKFDQLAQLTAALRPALAEGTGERLRAESEPMVTVREPAGRHAGSSTSSAPRTDGQRWWQVRDCPTTRYCPRP